MANRFTNAVQRGVCRGCNTDQPLAACNDPTCPTNQPWIERDDKDEPDEQTKE